MASSEGSGSTVVLQQALLDDSEFLQRLMEGTLQTLLDGQFTDFLGAQPYERTEGRQGYRNGRYVRTVITRVGPIELQVPRDRKGEFSPSLFARYRRSEKALMLSLVEMVLQGVSTGKVRKITEQLCGTSISSSTVSRLTTELDAELAIWRNRPVGACPYLFVDARYEDVRHAGHVVSMAVNIVYGVTAGGTRSILDVLVSHSENEASYKQLFSHLKERGLTGVKLVVSDNHEGLKNAVKASFVGASWHRCQVHFMRNLIQKVRPGDRGWMLAEMKDVYAAPNLKSAEQRLASLIERVRKPYPALADWLETDAPDTLTVFHFPQPHQRRLRTTNNIERVNQELKRRTRVIRIFPNEASCQRMITALCQEYSEQWETERRYLIMGTTDETDRKQQAV